VDIKAANRLSQTLQLFEKDPHELTYPHNRSLKMIRHEIQQLAKLGAFPASTKVDLKIIAVQEKLIRAVKPPITDEEAKELVKLFGPDDYFGAAWTVLHLVERAPGWPLEECLVGEPNEWIVRLKARCQRKEERG
jgi:hypothetical protein